MYRDCDEIFNENKNEILDLISQGWGLQRIIKKFNFDRHGKLFLNMILKRNNISYNENDYLTELECEMIDNLAKQNVAVARIARKIYRDVDMVNLYLQREAINPEGFEYYNWREYEIVKQLELLSDEEIRKIRQVYEECNSKEEYYQKLPEYSQTILTTLVVGISFDMRTCVRFRNTTIDIYNEYANLTKEQKELPKLNIADILYKNLNKKYRFYMVYKYLRLILAGELEEVVHTNSAYTLALKSSRRKNIMNLNNEEEKEEIIEPVIKTEPEETKITSSNIFAQKFQIKNKLTGVIDYNNETVHICFIDGDDIKFKLKDFDIFVQFINHMKSGQNLTGLIENLKGISPNQ